MPNWFDIYIGNLFRTKKEQQLRSLRASVHRETLGKVNGRVMSVQSEIDRKMFNAQRKVIDKATGKEKRRAEQRAKQQALLTGSSGPQAPAPKQQPGGGRQPPPQGKRPAPPPRPKGQGNMGLFGDNKKGAGRRPPQGRPPQGGQPYQQQDPYWNGAPPQQAYQQPQQPIPDYGGGAEKTQAIDLRSLKQKNERQVVGWLVATTGAHRGMDFRLYEGKNVIGTSADCDLVVTDSFLSARHCTVRYENGNFVVIDLDSRNGTYVNQKRISKEDLIDNDTVRLGKTEFKFKSLY